jgi:hypothetical protein
MGVIGRSKQCDRRPTLSELDALMHHFGVMTRVSDFVHERGASSPVAVLKVCQDLGANTSAPEIIGGITKTACAAAHARISVWCALLKWRKPFVRAAPFSDDRAASRIKSTG